MDHTRLEIRPGLWLDAARAVFFETASLFAVADLHLGYEWAHRHSGHLLPIPAGDETGERLTRLIDRYNPRKIVLLGDIVHRAVPLAPIEALLSDVLGKLSHRAEVILVTGNHDRNLAGLMRSARLDLPLHARHEHGRYCFVHGDLSVNWDGFLVLGHEHPALTVSDHVATSAKCPCFVLGEGHLLLPAFSRWAAGTEFRPGRSLSPVACNADFHTAIAILGHRLLPVPLGHRV